MTGECGPVAFEVLQVQSDADFQRLYDLFVEYEMALPPDLRHGSVPDVQALKARYDGENAAFLAMRGGRAIGCVAVTLLDAQTGVLARLFVEPNHRGIGAARGLVATAIQFLRDYGRRRVVLDTAKERLSEAYRLYLSFGFKECEPYGSVEYRCPTFMELQI